MSSVNLAEVLARFVRDGHDPVPVCERLEQAGIEIVPFSPRQAVLAATLVPVALPLGLSLGDRACLALALDRKIPALTADTVWKALDVDVRIQVIR